MVEKAAKEDEEDKIDHLGKTVSTSSLTAPKVSVSLFGEKAVTTNLPALADGAVSDLGHAPAAVSVDLMKGFVSPLTLIPVEGRNCYCY